MRVISKARLRDFWKKHPKAEEPLKRWWKIATRADWANLQDVRKTLPQADGVTLYCGLVVTVFNIAGNDFRLITRIVYEFRVIYVKIVLTHADYDRDGWRKQLCQE